jgi:hypothetical protein
MLTVIREQGKLKNIPEKGLFILESLQWFIHRRDAESAEEAQRVMFFSA